MSKNIITLSLPIPHPKKMSVRTPAATWFVIYDPSEQISHIASPNFSTATSLDIDINSQLGTTWIDGNKQIEPIFKEKGEYLIYLADNLETEPENTFHFSEKYTLK